MDVLPLKKFGAQAGVDLEQQGQIGGGHAGLFDDVFEHTEAGQAGGGRGSGVWFRKPPRSSMSVSR